jgi:hypothetical protein
LEAFAKFGSDLDAVTLNCKKEKKRWNLETRFLILIPLKTK